VFFLFTPVAAAVLLACLQGRSLVGLAQVRLAWWPLGLAAFGVLGIVLLVLARRRA
jgi:hypothetical protein